MVEIYFLTYNAEEKNAENCESFSTGVKRFNNFVNYIRNDENSHL